MTDPRSNPLQPTRLAAFVLFAVAVVAIGLGVLTLVNAPTHDAVADRAHGSGVSSGHPATSSATASSTQPVSSSSAAATVPVPVGAPADGQAPAVSTVEVRVYNNGTIKGLATCAANDFRQSGFTVTEVGNYSQSQGVIPTSTVYYSPSVPGEQQAAEQLGQQFGMRVDQRFPGIAFAPPGLIAIVTNDFKGAC